jgi:4-amino-4-deoxy-L-arabinose transferase-like glycosyltransferase
VTVTRAGAIATTAALGALLLGTNLGGYPLLDPDEAKHAEVAREMLVAGHWIEPTVNFQPYHHKPSVFYLLIGAGYRLLGVSELGARCVPALAALLVLLLVCHHGARRSPAEGLLAAFLLAACGFFVGVGRFTNFDAPLTLFLTAAVLAVARLIEDPGARTNAYVFFACAALAVLIKGPAALILTGIPVALALWRGELDPKARELARGTALAAAIVAAWLVTALITAPEYVAGFLWVHNVQRYLAPASADVFHPQPFWFYAPVIAGALLPWSPLLPATVGRALFGRGAERFLADYAVVVVLFFTLSSGKLATYVLPAFPALALLVARGLAQNAPADRLSGRGAASVGAAACALLAVVAYVSLRREAPGLEWMAALAAPVSLAGGAVVAAGRKMSTLRAVLVCAAGMTATVFLIATVGAAHIGRYTSDRDLASAALARGRPHRVIAYRVRPFSFQFYTEWPLLYRVPLDEVRQALYAPGSALVLTEERWAHHLEDAAPGIELREIARNPRHALYELVAPWSNAP